MFTQIICLSPIITNIEHLCTVHPGYLNHLTVRGVEIRKNKEKTGRLVMRDFILIIYSSRVLCLSV